jgi:ribosomal protein L33
MKKIIAIVIALSASLVMTGRVSANDSGGKVNMYRLYHQGNKEHFYTGDMNEVQTLVNGGWISEGIGFVAPKKSSTPVYRLYHKSLKDHHYTTDKNERDVLVNKHGWKYEGIGWYSSDAKKVALHRLYQPKLTSGSHHYTTDKNEKSTLAAQHGWKPEGVAWYAISGGNSKAKVVRNQFPKFIPVGTTSGNIQNNDDRLSDSEFVKYYPFYDGQLTSTTSIDRVIRALTKETLSDQAESPGYYEYIVHGSWKAPLGHTVYAPIFMSRFYAIKSMEEANKYAEYYYSTMKYTETSNREDELKLIRLEIKYHARS